MKTIEELIEYYKNCASFDYALKNENNLIERLDTDNRLYKHLKSFNSGNDLNKEQKDFPNLQEEDILNFIKYPNIVIDAENLYKCNVSFPYYCLIKFLYEKCPNCLINLHFVFKRGRIIEVLMMDIERIINMTNDERKNGFNESYEMSGKTYSGTFKGLHKMITKFNFYFHCIDTNGENGINTRKEADDMYFLNLYYKLSLYNNCFAMFSHDYKMLRDHIFSKAFEYYNPITVSIKKLNNNYEIVNYNEFIVTTKGLPLCKFYSEKLSAFSEIRKNIFRIDACHLEVESKKYEKSA